MYIAPQGFVDLDIAKWNTFLHYFGLGFTNVPSTGTEDVPIESTHPIFSGVDHLYAVDGTTIVDLEPADSRNQILVAREGSLKGFTASPPPIVLRRPDSRYSEKRAQQNHWSERGRATSVVNADALGRPRRSVLSVGSVTAEAVIELELLHSRLHGIQHSARTSPRARHDTAPNLHADAGRQSGRSLISSVLDAGPKACGVLIAQL